MSGVPHTSHSIIVRRSEEARLAKLIESGSRQPREHHEIAQTADNGAKSHKPTSVRPTPTRGVDLPPKSGFEGRAAIANTARTVENDPSRSSPAFSSRSASPMCSAESGPEQLQHHRCLRRSQRSNRRNAKLGSSRLRPMVSERSNYSRKRT